MTQLSLYQRSLSLVRFFRSRIDIRERFLVSLFTVCGGYHLSLSAYRAFKAPGLGYYYSEVNPACRHRLTCKQVRPHSRLSPVLTEKQKSKLEPDWKKNALPAWCLWFKFQGSGQSSQGTHFIFFKWGTKEAVWCFVCRWPSDPLVPLPDDRVTRTAVSWQVTRTSFKGSCSS